jgi:hypothetical protein
MSRTLLRVSLLAILLLSMACGGNDSDGSARAGPSPQETVESPEPPPTEEEEVDEEELPAGVRPTTRGLLVPGRYQTNIFSPAVTFEVDRGWRIPFEGNDYLVLARKLEPKDEVIYLDSSQSSLSVDAALQYAQDAFAGTTGVARDFRFTNAAPVRIGDLRGREITMNVRTDRLVVTLALGIEAYELRPGDKLQLNAIDVDGTTVLIFVEAPGARFATFSEQAQRAIDSFEFKM